MKSHPLQHLPALDGVRGLAVILVILFHSALIPTFGLAAKVLHKMTLTGWIGVDLFFVLSGFLITRILLNQKNSSHYFLNFYMRRILRLFPLYYLFLILFLVVFPERVQFDFTYWTFLSNILIGRLGHFQSSILDVTWSLAVEEQFYLLWPAIVWVLNKEKIQKLTIGLFFLALFTRVAFYWGGVAPMKNYVLLPCRLDALSVGAFLACSDLKFSLLRQKQFTGVFLFASFFVFLFGFSAADSLMRTIGYSIHAILSGGIISLLQAPKPSWIQNVFQKRFLRKCGKYSYAMYLFHVPVIHCLLRWGKSFWTLGSASPTASFVVQILFHLISVLATLGLSIILYHAFEKHFLRLKRFFSSEPTSTLSKASALN